MGMRTIMLKLHNPSKRKQQIMDEAMMNYSRAYQFLLDKAHEQIDEIEKGLKDERGKFRAVTLGKWIDKEIARELNSFEIEPFKDSLKMDFSMTLASFLTLKGMQNEVSYPIAFVSESKWKQSNDDALREVVEGTRTMEQYLRELRKLAQKVGTLKPIFFCRYATNRDYCLLYDSSKDRYYVKLYLMNVKSSNRKMPNIETEHDLQYIHRDGGILEKNSRRERFILLPLSFGKWQEQYLKMALKSPELLKTARLIKKGKEYFLSVNMDVGEAERVKTSTFLGLARGLKNAVHYTVVNREGALVSSGVVQVKAGTGGSPEVLPPNIIHTLANEIVSIARKKNAQVVMQAFIDRGDKLQWTDEYNERFTPVLNYRSYNKLLSILEYKLDGYGLPPPVKVSPVGVFYTCPNCGLHAARNRFSRDIFICIECGTTMNIEALGSLNIARKLIRYGTGLLKVKVERTSTGVKFINKDLGLEFVPSNPMDCLDEFSEEIRRIIADFYAQINTLAKDRTFKKKYSLIKRIEEEPDLTKLVEMI